MISFSVKSHLESKYRSDSEVADIQYKEWNNVSYSVLLDYLENTQKRK